MKKLALLVMAAVSVVALAGCSASMGSSTIKNQSNQTLSQKIVKGQTTESQVARMFGQPYSKTFKGNGDAEWLYQRNTVRNNFVSYIPIVGFFAGHQNDTNKILTILFHKNGTVKDWAWSNSTTALKAGL